MKKAAVVSAVLGFAGCGEIKTDASSGDDPVITAVTPDHGGADGGAMVTITGKNLSGEGTIVLVDGVLAKSATATSDTEVTFELPPGAEGHKVDVTVGTDHGFGTATQAFTFNLRPVVLGISPALGRFAGGTTVTITGRGFQNNEAGVPTVMIGGSAATNVQIVDDKTVMATNTAAIDGTPAFTPTDVLVTNTNGTATATEAIKLTKQGIIGTSPDGNAYWIDPQTKVAIAIGTLPQRMGACALAPNGMLLGRNEDPMTGKGLATFEPTSAIITSLGPFKEAAVVHQIGTMAFVGNNLFGASQGRFGGTTTTHILYQINQTNGALTPVGAANPTVFPFHSGIATKDGTSLYAVSASGNPLYTVAVASGAATPGPVLTGGTGEQLHAATTIGATLYVAEANAPAVVYSVNTTSGEMTRIMQVPTSIAAMCQTPPSY